MVIMLVMMIDDEAGNGEIFCTSFRTSLQSSKVHNKIHKPVCNVSI